jgi:hypothetical protein
MIRQAAVILALAAGTLATERPAHAFGPDGHRVIAEIAQRRLTPEAAAEVRDLLAVDNETSLAGIASWADHIRTWRRKTDQWHYVSIPVSANVYDASRDCPGNNCIVAKLEEFQAQLADVSLPKADRLEALRFVVHFVGDVHQPLHCSDNNDKDGAAEAVVGYDGGNNLHEVWDAGIIEEAGLDAADAPWRLNSQITDAEAEQWEEGTATDWVNESHAIAVSFIYKHLPGRTRRLPGGYQAQAEPLVELQLERAGVRLAAVLNRALQ